MRTPFVVAAALLVALAPAALAQSVDPVAGYRNIAGVNLIGLPFGLFSGEFEHIVQPGIVVGVGGTFERLVGSNDGDVHVSWVDAKAKYYPNEESFRGFSVGVTAGFVSASGVPGSGGFFGGGDYIGNIGGTTQSRTGPSVGVVLDYNWLLGRRKRLYVGTGIGAKRVFGDSGDNSVLEPVYPYGRLQIGFAY